MKYRMDQMVKLISCRIRLITEDGDFEFENGKLCPEAEFDKNYDITDITANADEIVISAKAHKMTKMFAWVGEEAVEIE